MDRPGDRIQASGSQQPPPPRSSRQTYHGRRRRPQQEGTTTPMGTLAARSWSRLDQPPQHQHADSGPGQAGQRPYHAGSTHQGGAGAEDAEEADSNSAEVQAPPLSDDANCSGVAEGHQQNPDQQRDLVIGPEEANRQIFDRRWNQVYQHIAHRDHRRGQARRKRSNELRGPESGNGRHHSRPRPEPTPSGGHLVCSEGS